MIRKVVFIISVLLLWCPRAYSQYIHTPDYISQRGSISTGAERTAEYVDLLRGKKVGILTNHTALVQGTHLVDTLISLGIDVRCVFAPEHGFRGDADAGAHVKTFTDPRTGIKVISVYGSNKKPAASDVAPLDIVVFDIQDVGLRFYTYLSSMHYMMETCAENNVPLMVLDRPNPNGSYVDGPILDMKHRSFVGMHPIPVVHGMTLGELARMINGEGWLDGKRTCDLTVIPCSGYERTDEYILPVKPSPNLPNMRSIYLYPSLCLFEGTPVSIGRGTDFPFQVFGHPQLKGYEFSFTPRSSDNAKNPPCKDRLCFGDDLRRYPADTFVIQNGLDLTYVIEAYRNLEMGDKFFTSMFELLIGVDYVREMIKEGKEAHQIKQMWQQDVLSFKEQRKPYLIYE